MDNKQNFELVRISMDLKQKFDGHEIRDEIEFRFGNLVKIKQKYDRNLLEIKYTFELVRNKLI